MQEMTARMETDQTKTKANLKEMKEEMLTDREEGKAERKANQENLKKMMEEIISAILAETKSIQGKADADREHMPEMTTDQARIETEMDAIQEKKDANLRVIIVEIKDGRKETTACQDAMEANQEKMEAADLKGNPE
jgi:hypothetical protein